MSWISLTLPSRNGIIATFAGTHFSVRFLSNVWARTEMRAYGSAGLRMARSVQG